MGWLFRGGLVQAGVFQGGYGFWRVAILAEDGCDTCLDPAETVTAAFVCGHPRVRLTRDEVLAELPWHAVVLPFDADAIAGIAAGLTSARALNLRATRRWSSS